MRAQKIGLLGGSFNPAHEGHREISLAALRILNLDQIWWLVSPQNPLKSADGMADFEERLKAAESIAHHPKIHVSDFEVRIREQRTARTIAALKVTYPQHKFVWLMGADNMIQFPKWQQWQRIMEMVPIAIFNRPGYTYRALNGKVASMYRKRRVLKTLSGDNRHRLAEMAPPAWAFLPETTIDLSSTKIRNYHDNAGNSCS